MSGHTSVSILPKLRKKNEKMISDKWISNSLENSDVQREKRVLIAKGDCFGSGLSLESICPKTLLPETLRVAI